MKKLEFFLILILSLNLCLALPLEQVKLSSYVNDYTNTLTMEEIQSLNVILDSLREKAETAIVIVDNFDGLSVEEYSLTIAHENLGTEKEDNGLLILIGMDVKEYRIEVGYGLEGELNDAKVGRLARENLNPFFEEGRFGDGLISLTNAIHTELLPDKQITGVYIPQTSSESYDYSIFAFIFFFIIIRAIIGAIYQAKTGKKDKDSDKFFTSALIASMFFRGGGGRGGGFGGFGGGGFGGGGFSGGWR